VSETNNTSQRQRRTGFLKKILVIVVAVLSVLVVLGLMLYSTGRQAARQMICGANLSRLGQAMAAYANDTGRGSYPAPDKWCDLLLGGDYAGGKCVFVGPAPGAGGCQYAMNPNCEPNSPPDIVLLFETKGGRNRSGGPEILTTDNHGGKGCNVLFNDGGVKFIPTDKLSKLKWKVEGSNNERNAK